MWKRRIMYVVIFLAMLGLYIATNKRQVFIILLFLVIIPLWSGAMLLMGARKIRIDCELQDACVIYQRIGMNIKVVDNSHMLLGRSYLQVEYENMLFHQTDRQNMYLQRGKTQTLYYELPYISENCGKIHMSFSKVVCFDLLGLFARKCEHISEQEFTVFPQIREVQVNMKRLPEALSDGYQYMESRKGQDVTEVFDIRDYRPGDTPRSIHWKLSSKLDNLVVREFSFPSNYDTLILYDTMFDKENPSYHEVVNGILGMTASISRGLMNQNHIHQVGCVSQEDYVSSTVDDNPSYMQMLTNMMSTRIAEEKEDTLDIFMNREIYRYFTKVVLVTGMFGEAKIQRLGNYVDLSVIMIVKAQEDHVEKGTNYDVITLSVDSMIGKVRMLDI